MNRIDVLDHGFVILRNLAGPTRRVGTYQASGELCTGAYPDDPSPLYPRPFDADDTDPANAARMSFDGSDRDRTYEDEMRLNRYLMINHHDTPFEMIQVWLDIKMPILVARQLVRHRTQGINEISGRYVKMPSEWYIPKLDDVLLQAKDKKQGGRPVDLNNPEEVGVAMRYRACLEEDCRDSYALYERAIADGIAMEQARCHLHLNHYTRWISTMNLRNTLHLLALRDHGHAQGENQQYARAITALLDPHLPGLMQLYRDIVRK